MYVKINARYVFVHLEYNHEPEIRNQEGDGRNRLRADDEQVDGSST